MDFGSILGILLCMALVGGAIFIGGGAGFIDPLSIMITLGGSLSAVLINFQVSKILATFRAVRKAFVNRDKDFLALFKQLSDFAVRARRDGILGLESDVETLQDPFMKKGLQMGVDGNSAEIIEAVLEQDICSMMERHAVGHAIFQAIAAFAPAFGMLGTLIGLIQMLRNLSDPSSIGAGMAVALITTLYGAMVANMVALPIGGKLEQRTKEETAMRRMVLQGILSIQQGDSPRVAQEKLRSYLSPSLRARTENV
ncbi:MAG TPA: motility protein A [Verrucomicrobia bacterium]|nr:motility protein A [Verrucomicrobiota bacterium]